MKKYLKELRQNSMRDREARFKLALTCFSVFILGFVCMIGMSSGVSGIASLAVMGAVPLIPFAKKDGDLSLEEKQSLGTIQAKVNEAMSDYMKGYKTSEDLDVIVKSFEDKLNTLNDDGKFGMAVKEFGEFKDTVKNMATAIEKMKESGVDLSAEASIDKQLDEFFATEKCQKFLNGTAKESGAFALKLKGIVSLGGNSEGNILINRQSNRVESKINEAKPHFRDFMMVDRGDSAYPMLTFTQITEFDRNAKFVSENGMLPESSVKMKEVTYQVSRVGTHMAISKRMLKAKSWLRTWIMNRVPGLIQLAEDFQIMFGDGTGDNLKGVINHEDVKCVSEFITKDIVKGVAGDVVSVSSYNGGKDTLIEFGKPFNSIESGMKITFTGATADSVLLVANELVKVTDREILLVGVAYAAEAKAKEMSFSVKNNFFNGVVSPDVSDAVKAIFGVLTYAQFTPNLLVLNPSLVFEAETAKDTTGRNLGLVENRNGVKYIAGRAVIESTQILPGKYLVGDFANGASLTDFTTLNIEFAEDVKTKLSNQVELIVQEEVILAVYNPWSFAYGNIADVMAAIKKTV